jgi:hypothetical protein
MGCEALPCVEKDKRWKFDPKFERCMHLGISSLHSKDACKLRNSRAGKELFRRNVYFNERSFPARLDQKTNRPPTPAGEVENTDNGEDLIGEEFADEGETFTVVGTDFKSGKDVLKRANKEGKGFYSAVAEVREWHNATKLALSACANHAEVCSASKRPHKHVCIGTRSLSPDTEHSDDSTTAETQAWSSSAEKLQASREFGQ